MSLSQIELCQLIWRKAARSMNAGDCVEVAPAKGKIFVRDSKNPNGPTLEYHADAWRNFLTEARLNGLDKR
jgi:hypothetical protein